MKLKKLLVMITTLSLFLSLSTSSLVYADNFNQITGNENTIVFIDVPNDYWAKDQIYYFVQRGIVSGYGDGTFRPDSGVTREEFCKLLVSTFNPPLSTPESPTFSDVSESRWSYPYIEVCKDFLTGYANPFGGLPAFQPTEYATREDIAVALVRMMGLSDSDVKDKQYAAWKFVDGETIAPNLLAYVSLACERGLVSGYPDGTFGPSRGITRAETIALLNRAMKQAVKNISSELEMSASIIYGEDRKTATINIIAEEGTEITVNGESVKMSSNHFDEYEGNLVYKFENEGSKDFVIEGKKAGKTKTINLTARYEFDAPTLKITSCPATSDIETITIEGTVEDPMQFYPAVTVNGEGVYVDHGLWSYETTLHEGENQITIVATNYLGKSATIVRTINFNADTPTLKITYCPTISSTETVTIKGTVHDKNDYYPTVTVNGNAVDARGGSWSYETTLNEGENQFTIVAENYLGKTSVENRKINFGVNAPMLKIIDCPAANETGTVTISGTVNDAHDHEPTVTVNGKNVSAYNGEWSCELRLEEGSNNISITATNDWGKTTTEERTIECFISAPEIQLINCPTETTNETVTVKGKITKGNIGTMLFINDLEVYVYRNGEFSTTLGLQEGENIVEFRAVNEYGKEINITKTITYTP